MPTILIVDDDEDLRLLFTDILAKYETIKAVNGEEAIELYKKYNPDIVLMDILMPGKGGIYATKEILAYDKNAKIAAITAFSNHSPEMITAGAKEVVEKPIYKNQLLQLIEKRLSDSE